jgi:hypothetical protein
LFSSDRSELQMPSPAPPAIADPPARAAKRRAVELIAAHDWAATPLGPRAGWPGALRTLVEVLLGSSQPMFVAWGEARTIIYNDAYTDILADKHPAAMGQTSTRSGPRSARS